MNTQVFTADGAVKDVFRVEHKCEVAFDFWYTGTGSLTLTRAPRNTPDGTYHTLLVATDPTVPLTGAAFTITAGLCTSLILPAGCYGVTIASASGLTLRMDVSGRWAVPGSGRTDD